MNNDRFKFRVWWKKRNRYLRAPVLIFGKVGSPREIFEEGKLTQCVPTEECEIECPTGLKDKNGNLIYESDIVLYDDSKYIVKWNERGSWYMERIGKSQTIWDLVPLDGINTMYLEICGNVHTEE